MEAGTGRPTGPDGLPLSPEEEAEFARAEARSSRRWAYGALFFALLATVGAAIALLFLFDEAESERASASRESVQELQDAVSRLNARSETRGERATQARSEADTADDRSRSLREQVEDLEGRVGNAEDSADTAQGQATSISDEFNDDLQQLREDVDRLERRRERR